MKKIILLLLLIPYLSFAQKEQHLTDKQQNKIQAKTDINLIKSNVILVRLSAKRNTINAMRKVGKNKLADKTEAKQLERNKAILTAFKTNFSFCPIYFFYSEDSKFVINNQLDSIHFLNDSLLVDRSIKVSSKVFYVADFGSLEPEKNEDKLSENDEESYSQSSSIIVAALIIKNNEFNQLRKPFPYYVREFKGLPFQRAIFRMVQKMNENLFAFYNNR